MSNWITDRLPTEADGDKDGDVWVRIRPDLVIVSRMHWSFVGPNTPWQRSQFWKPPAPQLKPEPEPEEVVAELRPRRFVFISRTVQANGFNTLDAIDDDGVAWWMVLGDIPGGFERDSAGKIVLSPNVWTRLSPLPARELPRF